MTSTTPTLLLNNGVEIPQEGFGVFRVDPHETARVVRDAIEVGYRHIDTASIYGNEQGVGQAIAEVITSGVAARDELFITTKLWNSDQADVEAAFAASLERLGLDYVDLYLIHWPAPALGNFEVAWKGLEAIAASGRARAIGVSNFLVPHLEALMGETSIVPAVNQIELHVDFQQAELRAFHARHGIATEAWGPLGQGAINASPELAAIARAHGATVPQAILKWHLQVGNIVIPKSNNRERMRENLDLGGFELGRSELETIAALDRAEAGRIGAHPHEVN
ncbi:aldo/keto reductase [Herbiconiux moechotypicola]|uniref:Aldo/keto reductase n=1 Tax=Herbiconiux moechotypicola TaxID=637393 RepID=A0ABN3DE76_9MICO|nr:aldo/keto reductase [Herbiconiux moechotypicola]MCS5729275.1 aldo/keto reductase [Herbiconiux moechotypicola]